MSFFGKLVGYVRALRYFPSLYFYSLIFKKQISEFKKKKENLKKKEKRRNNI